MLCGCGKKKSLRRRRQHDDDNNDNDDACDADYYRRAAVPTLAAATNTSTVRSTRCPPTVSLHSATTTVAPAKPPRTAAVSVLTADSRVLVLTSTSTSLRGQGRGPANYQHGRVVAASPECTVTVLKASNTAGNETASTVNEARCQLNAEHAVLNTVVEPEVVSVAGSAVTQQPTARLEARLKPLRLQQDSILAAQTRTAALSQQSQVGLTRIGTYVERTYRIAQIFAWHWTDSSTLLCVLLTS